MIKIFTNAHSHGTFSSAFHVQRIQFIWSDRIKLHAQNEYAILTRRKTNFINLGISNHDDNTIFVNNTAYIKIFIV